MLAFMKAYPYIVSDSYCTFRNLNVVRSQLYNETVNYTFPCTFTNLLSNASIMFEFYDDFITLDVILPNNQQWAAFKFNYETDGLLDLHSQFSSNVTHLCVPGIHLMTNDTFVCHLTTNEIAVVAFGFKAYTGMRSTVLIERASYFYMQNFQLVTY